MHAFRCYIFAARIACDSGPTCLVLSTRIFMSCDLYFFVFGVLMCRLFTIMNERMNVTSINKQPKINIKHSNKY